MAYERALESGERWLLDLRDRRILWVLPLIALAYFVWLLVVISSTNPPVFPVSTWVLLGTVIFIVIIAFEALLLVKTRTAPVAYPSQTRQDVQAEPEHLRPVPPPKGHTRADRDVVTWPPKKDQGGFYVTHHVQVGDDLVLAKRTFAVRPCAFCEFRESCFEGEHFYDRMDLGDDAVLDRDEFLQMEGCTHGLDHEDTI